MSIFFNFEVGSSGRRFRRAVDDDKYDISLFYDQECEKLFGTSDIGSLIETSVLSICMINEEKDVVGFMALSDRPNVPGVDPADWEIWIRNMFQRYYLSRNTLFIHLSCCLESVEEYFLDEALVSVFNNDVYIHQIVLVIPGDCTADVLLKYQTMKKRNVYRYSAKRDDDPDGSHCLITYARQEFCPKLKMRRAVEEDNDDIVEILDKTCPRLRDLYGDYYISELIGRHPESTRKIIVAEYLDRPVGVMCLNTDINYKKLHAIYDLGPYFGLMKPTSLDKEKAKRANELLQIFGEPIMNGKWRPYQEINKVETTHLNEEACKQTTVKTSKPRKTSKVNFGCKSMRKSLDDVMFSHRHSDDFSEKVYLESPTQSQATVYSVVDLLEEDPFDYEIVNIDKELLNVPDVISFSNLSKKVHWKESKLLERKRRRSLVCVKQSNIVETDTFMYEGQPNAFTIELMGFGDDIHDRHVFDLLEAAFELMKSYDYCIIKVPCAEKTFPLLQHFCFVATKNNICSPYALYVAHRSAVLGKLRVREAEIFDIPQIANLLQDLDGRETLWTIEHSLHHKDIHKAYVFLSALSIVGVGIVEPAEKIDFIRGKFNLDVYHNYRYHNSGNVNGAFITLKVVQTYPVFEVHFRFFIRELMRLSGSSSVIWMTSYRNKLVANKANALASAMIPLIPRKSEIDCVNIPELKKMSHMSQNITPFGTWFLGRKFTSVPKMDINTRIVVIGASRTAMAFLNALIFSDASSYLNFTNVTLVSPNGLHYIRQEKPIVEMMFPRNRTSTDKYLKSVPYTYYVNVIHGTMMDIDKRNKFITLSNCGKYYYDLLFLFFGRQYQHPNYLNNIHEKETRSANEHYVRLDIPRELDSDIHTLTENIPENVFIVNNKVQANVALDFVKTLKLQNEKSYKILVYGASIHAYCCIASLLELRIPPENIVYIEPFPPEDENKLRVPVFCNAYVDQTMMQMLESLKIVVYRSYYFQSWSVDEYNFVRHVNFLSHYQLLRVECSALFYYGRREISLEAIDAVIKSGIVHDGGILIDHQFKTKDPSVYAAGPATRYCRRYFAETFRQKYYDSYEIGYKLGVQIRDQLDPLFTAKKEPKKPETTVRFSTLSEISECTSASSDKSGGTSEKSSTKNSSNNTEERDEKLPLFKKPLTIHCTLPGGLQYLEVRPPGLKTPNYYVQTLEYNGFVMETFKEGYFKLHLNKDYIVDGVTCLTPERISLENFKNLYGLSAIVLNNVHIRYTTMKLDNFYEFFRSPWAFFLYHDQCDELFAMAKELRPKGQRKGDTLAEGLMAVGDKLSNPSFRFDTKMKIRSKFEHSPHVEAVTDYVIGWLSENDALLPMYLQPSDLVDYLHDLDRHPAFEKRKTKVMKMLQSIL